MKKILTIATLCLATFTTFAAFDTPEKTIEAFAKLGEDGGKISLSEFLPASYQKDLTGVIQLFATKMDGDVWKQSTDLLATAAKTLAPKAEYLLGSDIPEAERPAKIKTTSEGLTTLSTILASDTLKLENLKTTSSITLIDSLLNAALPALIDETTDPNTYKVVESKKLANGDVQLIFADDTLPKSFDGNIENKTVDFRAVEGCWVPTSMADSWTESMAQAKESLGRLDFTSTEGQQLKSQFLMAIPMLKAGLPNLGKAKTAEEFQTAGAGLLMPLMMLGGGAGM